jgi:hypothetical protein
MAWFTAMAFATWHGSPKSSMRLATIKVIIVIDFLFGVIWPMISLFKLNPGVLALVVVACALGVVIFCAASFTNSSPQAEEELSHRNKPFLLIPRLNGFGYVPNLANPAAWLLTLAPFVILLIGLKLIF